MTLAGIHMKIRGIIAVATAETGGGRICPSVAEFGRNIMRFLSEPSRHVNRFLTGSTFQDVEF